MEAGRLWSWTRRHTTHCLTHRIPFDKLDTEPNIMPPLGFFPPSTTLNITHFNTDLHSLITRSTASNYIHHHHSHS